MILKVMTYNIYDGGKDRMPEIKEVILRESPDILLLQEANDWDSSGVFSEIADILQVPKSQSLLLSANVRGDRGIRHNIACYSKYPIISYEVLDDPEEIWHVIGHLIIDVGQPLHVVPVHLSPKSEDFRLIEVKNIASIVKKYNNEALVVAGDLNSLFSEDKYPKTLPLELKDSNISKFGNPPRFEVMQNLTSEGLRSVVEFAPTVSKESADPDHLNLRLDYILVNTVLNDYFNKAYVVQDELVEHASDHAPVVAEFVL